MIAVGRYDVVETLAEGEQGALLRARVPGALGFEREVLVRQLTIARDAAAPLAAAAQNACSLVHPNLVLTWEFGEHDGAWFLAGELVRGRTLRRLLASSPAPSAPAAWRVVAGTARGLEHLHARGVLHGDVSPRTVLVSETGEVKLRDAGLPMLADARSAHRAPEQADGRGDPRSDVFSLAMLAREILGKGEARLEEVLARAASPRPEDRPPNAAALLASLQPWLWSVTGNAGADELASWVRPHMRAPLSSFPRASPEEPPGSVDASSTRLSGAAPDGMRGGTAVSAGVPEGTRGGTAVSAGIPDGTRGGTAVSAPSSDVSDATELRPRKPMPDRASTPIGPQKAEPPADLDALPGVRAMKAPPAPELPGGGGTKGGRGDATAMQGGLSRVGTGIVAIPASIRRTPPLAMIVLVASGILAGVAGVLAASAGPAPEEDPTPTPTAVAPVDPKFAGTLTVLSRPSGAKVLLDGKSWSTTPAEIPELEVGRSYRVDVKKDGFKTWTLDVKIQGGSPIELDAALEPVAAP